MITTSTKALHSTGYAFHPCLAIIYILAHKELMVLGVYHSIPRRKFNCLELQIRFRVLENSLIFT
jgi:hypothetical protein